MLGWGFALILVGGLSFVLPIIGRQFVLITLLGFSGMASSVAGIILMGVGIVFVRAGLRRQAEPTLKDGAAQALTIAANTGPTISDPEKEHMEQRRDIAAEGTVTIEWLERVFEGAFMSTVDRLENVLWIKGKRLTIQVILAPDRKALNLVLMHPLVPGANFLNAALAANNCNVRFGWCRFYIGQTADTNQHRLIVDFTLLFERGLIPYHLIKAFENLELVALKGIEAEFLPLIP